MRKILLASLCLFSGCIACGFNSDLCKADVYVVTDQNNSVISLSEQNDAVVAKGNNISIVKGNISNLPISGDATLYNFSNGAFILNKSKVQAKQAEQQTAIATQKSANDARTSGLAKIKALGLTDDEIKALWQ